MYSHKTVVDIPYSISSIADGEYPFDLDDEFQYAELAYLYFVDSNGFPKTPTAGTVSFQVCADGFSWKTVDGGTFTATAAFKFPPFHVGRAVAGRFVLQGVAGASGFKAMIRHSNVQSQSMRDLTTSANREYRRVRVDMGQTGFFEGREFRTFKRLNMATNDVLYMRFTCPVDFILFDERITLNSGEIDHTAYREATNITGTWEELPVIGRNIMSNRPKPYYEPVGVLEFLQPGGSFVPGVEVGPPLIPKTSGATAQQSSIPSGNSRERGLAGATYYLTSTCIGGPLKGVYYLDWEEKPFSS